MSIPSEGRPNISCDVFLCFGSDGLFRKEKAIAAFGIESDCIPHCLLIGRDFTTHRLTPLMKPLRLFLGCVELLSEPKDAVCDLFVSSGTTLVACEKFGRIGLGMELEPKFIAVTLERLSDMGLKPRLARSPNDQAQRPGTPQESTLTIGTGKHRTED